MRFAGAAMSSDYAGSAGDGGSSLFQQISKKAPDFGALSNIGMAEQSKQKQTATNNAAKVAGTGIQSLGKAVAAMNGAQAEVAAAESQASATKQNGMMSMIGSIGGAAVGAFAPSFEYGTTKMGAGNGNVGGYGTFGPNYGIKQ
tara:strand:+ start:41 stop:472 length:432 start_codon:yes stop_codon:yes gene_type:complete